MDVTKRDLLIAYRKTKVDCIGSRLPERRKFLNCENHFDSRIERLLRALKEDDFERIRRLCKFGYYLVPKRAVEKRRNEDKRIVDYRAGKRPGEVDRYELRIMADVSVEFHILSTLWILKVGEKYEAKISRNSYAARITRQLASEPDVIGPVDELSLGSFRSYRDSYKEWFDSSFDAVKKGAQWLLYLDVESFYRNIDSGILLDETFTNRIGVSLTDAEKRFTKLIVDLLREWAESTPLKQGLPTGMAIADVIANVSMYDLDHEFEEFALQVGGSYGRYCDDILLVGGNRPVTGFEELESEYASAMRRDGRYATVSFLDLSCIINKGEVGETKLKFNADKSKLYLYDKGASVEASMEEIDKCDRYNSLNSKEKDSNDVILSMTFRRILSRDDAVPDVKTQGISPLRSEFANIVSDFEALGNALLPGEWEHERIIALERIKNSYLDKAAYYELHDYFPRLLTAAGMPTIALKYGVEVGVQNDDIIANPEWRLIVDILKAIRQNVVFEGKANVYVDGQLCSRRLRTNVQKRLQCYVEQSFLESLLIAQRSTFEGVEMIIGHILAFSFGEDILRFSVGAFRSLPSWKDFAQHDLCRTSIVDLDMFHDDYVKGSGINGSEVYGLESKKILRLLHKQYSYSGKTLPWSILFPCHEVDYGRFSFLFDEVKVGAEIFADVGRVYSQIYGVLFQGSITSERDGDIINVYVNDKDGSPGGCANRRQEGRDINVAIAHWQGNQGNESPLHCYNRLRRVVEGILALEKPPKYLIMPELSIRRKWFWEVSKKLISHKISFVAGIDHVFCDTTHAINRVLCSLVVSNSSKHVRPQGVVVAFDKMFPAEAEIDLLRKIGSEFRPDPLLEKGIIKIVHHDNEDLSLSFGLMICRDFTDMALRSKMRGRVDLIIVPCWNKDIHTYSSLVEATASDLHSYVICVNDRRYGDTRIRVPAKESWARDIVRISGGEEDLVMIGTLRIGELRREQSKMLLGLSSEAFKPLPTGYENKGTRLEAYKNYNEIDLDDSSDYSF